MKEFDELLIDDSAPSPEREVYRPQPKRRRMAESVPGDKGDEERPVTRMPAIGEVFADRESFLEQRRETRGALRSRAIARVRARKQGQRT